MPATRADPHFPARRSARLPWRLALGVLVVVLVAVGILSLTFAAQAQTVAAAADTVVTIPYGTWLSDAAATIWAFLAALAMWALRKLPAQAAGILMMLRAEQLLARARDYGINATKGAAEGKTLSIDVGSAVLARALRYAVENGPRWLVRWLGGEGGIREKLIARIPTDAATTLAEARPKTSFGEDASAFAAEMMHGGGMMMEPRQPVPRRRHGESEEAN